MAVLGCLARVVPKYQELRLSEVVISDPYQASLMTVEEHTET